MCRRRCSPAPTRSSNDRRATAPAYAAVNSRRNSRIAPLASRHTSRSPFCAKRLRRCESRARSSSEFSSASTGSVLTNRHDFSKAASSSSSTSTTFSTPRLQSIYPHISPRLWSVQRFEVMVHRHNVLRCGETIDAGTQVRADAGVRCSVPVFPLTDEQRSAGQHRRYRGSSRG